jgi:hypothetical protein
MLMRDATSIDQWIDMTLRNSSDQKGCPQSALQSLENQSQFPVFWLIKKENGIRPDEWITYCIFDGSCGFTMAANFRPLTFGRLLAQVHRGV